MHKTRYGMILLLGALRAEATSEPPQPMPPYDFQVQCTADLYEQTWTRGDADPVHRLGRMELSFKRSDFQTSPSHDSIEVRTEAKSWTPVKKDYTNGEVPQQAEHRIDLGIHKRKDKGGEFYLSLQIVVSHKVPPDYKTATAGQSVPLRSPMISLYTELSESSVWKLDQPDLGAGKSYSTQLTVDCHLKTFETRRTRPKS